MEPLKGIRILDASHVIAGPFASYQLVLLGADVIRIDRIENQDFTRFHGGTPEMKAAGLAASFVSQNAGKSCIQLNFKDPRGVEIFKQLAATCDIVLENFRPGVMTALGLGYDDIRAVRPDIIYCSVTGYGPDGPMRNAPAYDHIVQGVSSLMSTTGTEETGPLRVGVPITDYLAGYNGALAMMSALYQRQATGEGQHVHVTMLASALPVLGAAAVELQTSGDTRTLMGDNPFSDSPFAGRFDTQDGYLVVTANTAAQAESLIKVLGVTSLVNELDTILAGGTLSEQQRKNASRALREAFLGDTAIAWEAKLSQASVPAGKVRSLSEILDHPQTAAIGCLDQVAAVGFDEKVGVPGLAFKSNPSHARELPDPEASGQSTLSVLEDIGLSRAQIDDYARAGVVAGAGLPARAT